MSAKLSSGTIQFSVGFKSAAAPIRREPESPFVLAVLGDFTGRDSRGVQEPVRERKVWQVNCDNFEQVFARLNPQLQLPVPGLQTAPLELTFASMEDFHPDRLLGKVPRLAAWHALRERLLNAATSASAAAELQGLLAVPLPQQAEPTPSTATTESDVDTMSRLLGGASPAASAPKLPAPSSPVERIVKQALGSAAVPSASPHQTALRSALEMTLADQVRSVLHAPHFQALEATWRGLDLLVRNFGGEENLKLCVVDVSREELASDLRNQESLDSCGLWKLLERQAPDAPWSAWLGLHHFGNDPLELETLGLLARLSAQARAPFITGASPGLVGCDSFGAHPDPDDWKQPLSAEIRENWRALRAMPEAAHLGLALPRFLLRLPYGKQGEPIESFAFEELPTDAPHESYLWGNSALLCGYLLSSAFQSEGWDFQPELSDEVTDLPVYSFSKDGETEVKPCAEAWLTDRGGQTILDAGLIPVLSIKGRDAVRIMTLQSVAGSALEIG